MVRTSRYEFDSSAHFRVYQGIFFESELLLRDDEYASIESALKRHLSRNDSEQQ